MVSASSSAKKYNFTGKVALITGSSSGIGAAIAIQFAQYGASLTITGRDASALNEVAKQIESISGNAPLQIVGDLLDQTVVSKLIEKTVEKYGRLDILVNNAGGATPVRSLDENVNVLEAYDKVFALNVRSVVQLTHLAVPHLSATKGNVINISSIASIAPHFLLYSMSKAALDMFTRTSANLLAAQSPGPVNTNLHRSVATANSEQNAKLFQERAKKFIQMIPLKRRAEAVEIANVASFLAFDQTAANMTGSIVVSDGGMLVYAPTF